MRHTVIITRPRGPYVGERDLARRLEVAGYAVISLVSLEVATLSLKPEELNQIEVLLSSPQSWIVFLSPTAVCVFEFIARERRINLPNSPARVAAQGPGTSEVARRVFQREVDVESTVSTAESFADQLSARLERGCAVLVPQSAEGRDVVAPVLRAQGLQVATVSTYELRRVDPEPSSIDGVLASDLDSSCIVFMSPSAVRATVESFPDAERLRALRAISIGPSTSKAMRECGLSVYAEATDHTEDGVIRCVKGALKV